MHEDTRETEPILSEIKNGWAALGDGWAVHGRTKDEALQKYYEAEVKHREIEQRPLKRFEWGAEEH